MKVLILAGGWGTRLGSLGAHIPKPMVLIGGKPVLWHIMKTYSTYGYNEFVIALGAKGQVIKEYFFNYEAIYRDFTMDMADGAIQFHSEHDESEWKVTLVDTGLNTLKGGRIKRVEKYLGDINMLTYGDGVADIQIDKLVEFHKTHGKLITFSGVYPSGRFGEFEETNNLVKRFKEKPNHGKSFINGGYMVFNKELLQDLSTDEKCDFERGALEDLAAKGQVMVYKHNGRWDCMDSEQDVHRLNRLWDEDNAFWKVWVN